MAGRRARAAEDLRVGGSSGSGIRPGILQALFRGGPARPTAGADLRTGRNQVKPRVSQPLFRGGPAKATAGKDLRAGSDDESSMRPAQDRMLADGGELDDGDAFDVDVSDGEIVAAEDVMDCISGGYCGPSPSESDSKVEKASKEAARRARAKVLAQALKAFLRVADEG